MAKRSRFYQAMMDTDFLQKGNSYRKLPEGKVLFLCTFDPFGKGNDKYSFVNRCEEVSGMVLEDGCIKVFYNCTCDSEKLSKDLRDLYHFIMTGEPGMQLTERLNEAGKRLSVSFKRCIPYRWRKRKHTSNCRVVMQSSLYVTTELCI